MAHQLREEFGSGVALTVGAFPFPRAAEVKPLTERRSVGRPDLSFRVDGGGLEAASGDVAAGDIMITNHSDGWVTGECGAPILGALTDETGVVVGCYSGLIAGVGRDLTIAPGESDTVPIIVGTESADPSLGSVLPPGQYQLAVPLPLENDVQLIATTVTVKVTSPAG